MTTSNLKHWLSRGELDKLENVVLEGRGARLLGEQSPDLRTRVFLKGLPNYLTKISQIHDAVIRGSLAEVQRIVDGEPKKKLVVAKDSAGTPLIHKAVYYDHQNVVEWIVDNYPTTVEQKDKEGRTALHYCAACRDPEAVWDILIEAGCDASVCDKKGNPAAYYLQRGAEIELPDPEKMLGHRGRRRHTKHDNPQANSLDFKPSNIRIWIHNRDIGKLQQVLWEGHGAKLRCETSNNVRVRRFLEAVPFIMGTIKDIHAATIKNDIDTFRKKVEDPVSPIILSSKDCNGLNVLHKAAGLGYVELAKEILDKYPAIVSAQDGDGRIPLHYAAVCRDGGVMFDLLVEYGSDESKLDNRGKVAAFYKNRPMDIDLSSLVTVPDAPRVSGTNYPRHWDWRIIDSDQPLPRIKRTGNNADDDSAFGSAESAKLTEEITTPEPLTKQIENAEDEMNGNEEEPEAEEGDAQADEGDEQADECDAQVDEGDADENDNPAENEEEVVAVAEEGELHDNNNNEVAEVKAERAVTTYSTKSVPEFAEPTSEVTQFELTEAVSSSKPTSVKSECIAKTASAKTKLNSKSASVRTESTSKSVSIKTEPNPKSASTKTELTSNFKSEFFKAESNSKPSSTETEFSSKPTHVKTGVTSKSTSGKMKPMSKIDENEFVQMEPTPELTKKPTSQPSEIESMESAATSKPASANVDPTSELSEIESVESEATSKAASANMILEIHNYAPNEFESTLEMYKIDSTEIEPTSKRASAKSKPTSKPAFTKAEPTLEFPESAPAYPEPTLKVAEVKTKAEDEVEVEVGAGAGAKVEVEAGVQGGDDAEAEDSGEAQENQKENQEHEEEEAPPVEEADKETSEAEVPVEESEAADPAAEVEESDEGDDKVEPSTADSGVVRTPNDEEQADEEAPDVQQEEEAPAEGEEGKEEEEEEEDGNEEQAAADDEEAAELAENGTMEQLAALVLSGEGHRLVNRHSSNPELQAFIDNVPTYMSKIRAVHRAAKDGNLKELQISLDRRKFAMAKDQSSPHGATPLHVAVIFGHTTIVRYLAGRFPETTHALDLDGRTPLHYAATLADNGHYYNLLLHLGANPLVQDNFGQKAEYYKHNQDDLSHKQLLRDFGAPESLADEMLVDKDLKIFHDEEGRYLVSSLGDPLIKGLTEVATTRPKDPVTYLATYLYNFANQEKPKDNKDSNILIIPEQQNGHDGNEEENQDNENDDGYPQSPDFDAPESLFSETERDENGQSSLHFAANRSHSKDGLYQHLLETQINVALRDSKYRTGRDVAEASGNRGNIQEIDRFVVYLAARGETDKLVELLMEGYDHILDTEDDDKNILQIAEEEGNTSTVEFLKSIENYTDLRDEIHRGIRAGNLPKVRELLEMNGKGAKLLALGKNTNGRCSLHVAVLMEHEDIVDYLAKTYPETLQIGDNLERTALHYAMGVPSVEVMSSMLVKAGAKRIQKDLKSRQPSYYYMNKTDIEELQREEESLAK
ncbi:uncharacterized protein LOC131666023 isoform X2 [Phymastichus coffea]|uniref:uncharacterized protein LOC131666023 isoform X2 n=1 Tax=Phymastichus coffea TaxID=108790 RepID=UPI00273CD86A|nr:uncharacterized protein LOC131666023 isoform X2 [Phymastichus coffea]